MSESNSIIEPPFLSNMTFEFQIYFLNSLTLISRPTLSFFFNFGFIMVDYREEKGIVQ